MDGSFRSAQNAKAKLTTSIVYVQPEADPGHEHAGQQRAGGHGQSEAHHVQGVGGRQQFLAHQDRDDGAAGRLVYGLRAALHRHQRVQQPHVAQLQPGLQGERGCG
jgi:hypothetical protein